MPAKPLPLHHTGANAYRRRKLRSMGSPTPPGAPEPPTAAAPRLARIARNAVANLLRLGATWLIVLAVPPLLVRHLDKPAYATWMLVLQIGAYATLFDGGLQLAVGRYVAQAEQSGDRQSLGAVLSSAASLFTGAAALLLLAVVSLSLELGRLFHSIPTPLVHPARMALLLVGGSLALAFPSSVLAGLSLGLERNQVNAVAGGVSKLAGAAGTVWAAVHGQGLVAMAWWTAAGTLVQPLIFLAASRGHQLRSLLRPALVRAGVMWEFARFCSAAMASQLGMLLISGLDLPIVVAFDFRNAGYYALATTASNMLLVPFGAVLSTLVPLLSGMSMDGDAERMGRVLVRTTRLSTAMLALLAVPLMVGMPVLLSLWIGADYARHTLLFAELLLGAQLVRLTLSPYAMMAFSAGEQRRILLSPAVESLVNLGCSLLLVRRIGAAGVAAGTLIGAVLGVALHFWNSMANTRNSIRFSRWELLREGVLKPAAWIAVPALLLAVALSEAAGLLSGLCVLAAGTLVLATVLWKGTLKSEDRSAFRALGARLLPPGLRLRGMRA